MNGPRQLWSGDWLSESEAARARMAQRRGVPAAFEDEPTEEHPVVSPPARRSLRDVVLAAVAAVAAAWHRLSARVRGRVSGRPRSRRSLRSRLILIAVLSGVAGAAVMVGIEAATGTGAGTPASAAASRPYLGVEVGAPLLGQGGALVELVEPGSPAAAAGLMPGDVITSVDGKAVTSAQAAVAAIAAEHPGQSVTLGLDRFGQQVTVKVTLGTRPTGSP
jgi:membrane-associated protease RseP (regulator of RpoE activity)